jgi:hypothetical protein
MQCLRLGWISQRVARRHGRTGFSLAPRLPWSGRGVGFSAAHRVPARRRGDRGRSGHSAGATAGCDPHAPSKRELSVAAERSRSASAHRASPVGAAAGPASAGSSGFGGPFRRHSGIRSARGEPADNPCNGSRRALSCGRVGTSVSKDYTKESCAAPEGIFNSLLVGVSSGCRKKSTVGFLRPNPRHSVLGEQQSTCQPHCRHWRGDNVARQVEAGLRGERYVPPKAHESAIFENPRSLCADAS